MQSRTTRQFWRLFSNLPFEAQRDAKRAYRLFQEIPRTLACSSKSWKAKIASTRFGLGYRALAVMKKDRIVWYWIGSHAEYDRLV